MKNNVFESDSSRKRFADPELKLIEFEQRDVISESPFDDPDAGTWI